MTPGVCRAYCCGDVEACGADTFCRTSVIANADRKPPDTFSPIPTCTPVTPCTLLDDNSCKDGLVCTIVRTDGTTSCDSPGTGMAGDACPCAKDHVCSKGLNECMKICKTNDANTCPTGHTCQGGSKSYPAGFGICVAN